MALELQPVEASTYVEISTGSAALGRLKLWVPEGIETNAGCSAVYPVGHWKAMPSGLVQQVPVEDSVGPGNCPRISPDEFECCGIRFPADSPVEWRTEVSAQGDGVRFTLWVTNRGAAVMRKAGAAICLKFEDGAWWSDETTYAVSDGMLVSLAALGRGAGRPNGFQAYLLRGQTFDHVFYREYWGFNERRVDRALLVSEHAGAGLCVGIEAPAAYFVHSNPGNPCTDLMLALGDIAPGQSAQAWGTVWVRPAPVQGLPPKAT
jgi:hypothetical protein